jgi:hypothetical protein
VKTFAFTTLIAIGLAASSTAALAMDEATKKAVATCQGQDTEPKAGIEACTTVLSNVKMGAKTTLAIHYYRGVFYVSDGNNTKAAEDFTAAVNTYENDPDKANWPVDFVGLAASSYAFRAQGALAQKKCDAAKADYQKAAATAREVSERTDYEKKAGAICK